MLPRSPACVPACAPAALPGLSAPLGAAAHTVNTTPFFAGALVFICNSLGQGFPPLWAPRCLCCGSGVFGAELQRCSSVPLSHLMLPQGSKRSLCFATWAPHWMERQGLGHGGASFPLISVKFHFWKQRNGTCCLHCAILGHRRGENHPGGLCGCSSSPQPPQEAIAAPTFCCCLESPLLPLLFFLKHRDPGSPSHLNRAGQTEKHRTGALA